MLKKLWSSKVFKLAISLVLIYFAFRKVNLEKIVTELGTVPWWFVVAMIAYYGLVTLLGSYRWSLLLFKKPTLEIVLNFARASYIGAFYALFFPSGVAGDFIKWVPLQKKYPELTKVKLLSSVLLDRIIGFSAFILVAFVSSCIALATKLPIPIYLFWLFLGLCLGVVGFYLAVYLLDLEKILAKIPLLDKLVSIVDLLKKENKTRILWALVVAFFSEFTWITPVWFVSLIFKAGFSLLSVYVFMPIISLILVLPISIAGFGARETLYLYFFSQLGIADEKILIVSTFLGILGLLNSLVGGFLTLF